LIAARARVARIAEDVDGADLSNVSGTPTFFINGRRHYGAYDINSLTQAVRAARATIAASGRSERLRCCRRQERALIAATSNL